MVLRRSAAFAAAVLAAPALLVVGQQAADAATTCRVNGPHDAGLYTRACTVDSSRIGGRIRGVVYWDYKQSSGRGDTGEATLQVNDRTADGTCSRLKITYRGSDPWETVNKKACNGKQYGPQHFTLNSGDSGTYGIHPDGYYTIYHCSNSTQKSCIILWRQRVGQRPPG